MCYRYFQFLVRMLHRVTFRSSRTHLTPTHQDTRTASDSDYEGAWEFVEGVCPLTHRISVVFSGEMPRVTVNIVVFFCSKRTPSKCYGGSVSSSPARCSASADSRGSATLINKGALGPVAVVCRIVGTASVHAARNAVSHPLQVRRHDCNRVCFTPQRAPRTWQHTEILTTPHNTTRGPSDVCRLQGLL